MGEALLDVEPRQVARAGMSEALLGLVAQLEGLMTQLEGADGSNPFLAAKAIETQLLWFLVAQLERGDAVSAAKAAGVLANLASEHDDTCVDIAEAGAVGPLVALLGSESEDGKVHAARTLSGIAFHDDYVESIVEAGAIAPLLELLGSESQEAKEDAAKTLAFLAAGDSENAAAIVEAGAIVPLTALLVNGTEAGKGFAAKALGTVAVHHSAANAARSSRSSRS